MAILLITIVWILLEKWNKPFPFLMVLTPQFTIVELKANKFKNALHKRRIAKRREIGIKIDWKIYYKKDKKRHSECKKEKIQLILKKCSRQVEKVVCNFKVPVLADYKFGINNRI